MMSFYENRRAYCVVARRTCDPENLGTWQKPSAAVGPACPNYPVGCRRDAEPGCGTGSEGLVSDGAFVAATLSGAAPAGTGKGCSPARSSSSDSGSKDSRRGGSDAAHDAARSHPLEYAHDGKSPRGERGDHSTNLEAAQPPTASCGNLPAQPGQTFYRKASRRGRAVSESTGQGAGAVRRREKPDSSAGQNPASVAVAAWDSRSPDTRLQAQRHHDLVRRAQHAGWQGHWPLHAAASPSGIYPLPETDRYGHTDGVGLAFDRGQLQHPQAPPRRVVVETPSPFPFALYPDLQFLAQSRRALVPRDHRQTTAPRNL